MTKFENKIDFAVVISVNNANPNGDPLDGNRPRTTLTGLGEMSDVCLKRKIRNRLLDEGHSILVQSDDRRAPGDSFRSIQDRVNSVTELKNIKDKDEYIRISSEKWFDVRAFGQVFAFKGTGKEGEYDANSTSIGVRGPVSIHPAFSLEPVEITELQITKSVNLKTDKADPNKKGKDTMGSKARIDKGVYVTKGSISVQLSEKTGFSEEDAEAIKQALLTLFENDVSAARPDGSMEVLKVIWWKHNCKSGQYSSAKVHRSLHVDSDGKVTVDELPGLSVEVLDGV
jgi:CRISPR-associated protein Csd2